MRITNCISGDREKILQSSSRTEPGMSLIRNYFIFGVMWLLIQILLNMFNMIQCMLNTLHGSTWHNSNLSSRWTFSTLSEFSFSKYWHSFSSGLFIHLIKFTWTGGEVRFFSKDETTKELVSTVGNFIKGSLKKCCFILDTPTVK